jgi:hypothetical protein
MKERITLQTILEHIQESNNNVQQQIARLEQKMDIGFHNVRLRFEKVDRQFEQVDRQFEDARLHRQALQEDLEETMRVQFKHGRQLHKLQAA